MSQFPSQPRPVEPRQDHGFRLSGAAAGDFSGGSVASAGDVNGDGFADLIVGADGADPHGNNNSGASYVVFGRTSGGFAANLTITAADFLFY